MTTSSEMRLDRLREHVVAVREQSEAEFAAALDAYVGAERAAALFAASAAVDDVDPAPQGRYPAA